MWPRLVLHGRSYPQKKNSSIPYKSAKHAKPNFKYWVLLFHANLATRQKPLIFFNKKDLLSPTRFGRKALQELNTLTEENFGKPIQDVLIDTPRSRLSKKPTSDEWKRERRRVEREVRDDMQKDKDEHGDWLVMQNRISWNACNRIRKTERLLPHQRENAKEMKIYQLKKKRKHGCNLENLAINADQLLREASTWSPTERINWSKLGEMYGLTTPNRGQVIKEFL